MGVCVAKLPHSCGTRKGLQVFADPETGRLNGFCFACAKPVLNPYGEEKSIKDIELPKAKTEAEIQAEIAEVSGYPIMDIKSRKLRAKFLDMFDIRIGLSEEDGKTPYAMYFPQTRDGKLVGYYVKTLSKPSYTWSIGDVKKADPFGWEAAKRSGAYRLIVTEGPEDAVAVKQIYERYGDEEYIPAVVSLSNGVNSVKSNLAPKVDVIKSLFREVIFCFDDDEAGHKAVTEAMLIFPKALSVTLPDKDANACLIEGSAQAAYKALAYSAKAPKNTRIVNSYDTYHERTRVPTPRGRFTWPFPKLDKALRGLRTGEVIYIGAAVKMGKTELCNQLIEHFILKEDVPVLFLKAEDSGDFGYKAVLNKVGHARFTDPDVPFDVDKYDKAGLKVRKNLYQIDMYQHAGWETLRADIVEAASMGVKAIFIDPITNLTSGTESAQANTMLETIAKESASLALDLDIVIFFFCHLKAPEGNISQDVRNKYYREGKYIHLGNCSHELGGNILSTQFTGSRAMMRSCQLMLALEGNKDLELPEDIQSLRYITILEDRAFGNSATFPLHYNQGTTQFTEI